MNKRGNFKKTKKCMFCKIGFDKLPKSKKVRRHDQLVKPVYAKEKVGSLTKYTCTSDDYIGFSCLSCNFLVTQKHIDSPMLFHNFSGYNSSVLLPGMVNLTKRLKKIKIMPKGATGYHMIKYKNLKMIDSCGFMQGSLSALVDLLMKKVDNSSSDCKMEDLFPNTVACVKESRFDNAVIPLLTGKLSYPHGLIQNLEDFEKTTAFPSQDDFYDKLSETHISNKDYADAKRIYEVSKCRHMKDLHDLYLMLDVSYLADTWRDFTYKIHKDFKVYPSNYTTGPSLFYACAMRKSETPIRRLEDLGMYDRFNNGIKGGFTVVNKRHTVANCIEMGDKFDPNQPASSILFGDFNSLYGGTLRAPMPYDKMEFLDDARVEVYNKDPREFLKIDTSDTAEIGYWATVDFTIPDALKEFTDDLPLGLVNSQAIYASDYTRSLGKAGEQKLIAGHFGLEQYGMHIKLLQFYIKLGVEITKVHDIIRFKQKPLFRPYIDHCLSKRAEASANNDPVQKRLYKLLANSLYGKCLQSDLKYNSNSVLVEIGERYSRLVGNPRFKSRKWIIPDKVALVTKSKAEIKLRAPIFIGACVLQLAKLVNYEFLLGVAKPSCSDFPEVFNRIIKREDYDLIMASRKFIQSIKMLYADTDSQMLHITYTKNATNMTQDYLYNHTFLSKYLDRSNFKSLSKESSCQPGEIGYIKPFR